VTLTVRLDDETRDLLEKLARSSGAARSEVVRRAIRLLAQQEPATAEADPYREVRHLIGTVRGGPPNLSQRTGDRFRELLQKKRK